jgi:acetyltransferase
LILGCSTDPQFGPVLLFGTGGQLVEVWRDRALGLPPLNTTLARRLIEQTRIAQALHGVRGRAPVDLASLEQLLVRFSYLVVEQPRIKEIDINPLLALPEQLLALDARVVLHPAEVSDAQLPRPAIRPYPSQYASPFTMRNGTTVVIRPIRPADESLLVSFHEKLSMESVYSRYFQAFQLSQRVKHDRLSRICFIDFDREMALVAELRAADGSVEIVGVGRLTTAYGTRDAEFALLIADAYQRQGLGKEILRRLVEVGRAERWSRIVGHVLATNQGMQRVCEQLGFTISPTQSGEELLVSLEV